MSAEIIPVMLIDAASVFRLRLLGRGKKRKKKQKILFREVITVVHW